MNKLSEFKLDKGDVSSEYDSALKIENKIKEIKSIVDNINIVPLPIGGVLLMYNNTNPSEMYNGTTWELISSDKYLRTTTGTPLSTGGSNSVSIQKANLPNVKLKVSSFAMTTSPHNHGIKSGGGFNDATPKYNNGNSHYNWGTTLYTNNGGGQNTGTASPSTETLGSGTALSIQPEYVTLKFWKRLS